MLSKLKLGGGSAAQVPPVSTETVQHAKIGRGLESVGANGIDLKAIADKLGISQSPSKSSVAEKNAAAMPDVKLRYATGDSETAQFARFAIDSQLAVMQKAEEARAKAEKRPPMSAEQHLLRMLGSEGVTHLRVALGVDENLEGKSADEVMKRQLLSKAIVADLAERAWTQIPIDRLFRDMPQVAASLLDAETPKASELIETKMQTALAAQQLRRLLDDVRLAKEKGMELPMGDQKLVSQAEKNADADPWAAYKTVESLVDKATAFLENAPEEKISLADFAKLKKSQKKEAPPPDPEVLMQKAMIRAQELEGSVKGAPTPDEKARYRGAMIGAAVGDALGAGTEFLPREVIYQRHGFVTDLIGGGTFNWKPGEYTDDTQMAEYMANSIVKKGRFDIEDVGAHFAEWLKSNPPDVGNLTRQALQLRAIGVPSEQSGTIPWVMGGYENAGNGSVMRAAPVALLTAFKPVEEIDATARASSAITHADPRATYGTAAISYALSLIIKGEKNPTDKVIDWLKDKNPVLAEAIEQAKTMPLEDVRTSGYVVHTVQAAFWTLEHATSYVDGILKIANLGEDTDTAGATAGILLGAKFGIEGIPQSWRKQLQGTEKLEGLADQIYGLAKA
jgi:ADP-ribosyl-[dinitrogen reductase] hydrolase